MASAPQYRWDAEALRFRDSRGRYVSPEFVRSAVDAVAAVAADELEELARSLISGEIDIQQFHESARDVIRKAHVASAAIAVGGRDRMDQSALGRAGARIRQEFGFLYQFAREIERGEVTEAKLIARIRMYGESATVAYEAARRARMIDAGYREEMRVLNSSVPCPECSAYAKLRWQPVGTLPNTGEECSCLTRCKCTFRYRKRARGRAAA